VPPSEPYPPVGLLQLLQNSFDWRVAGQCDVRPAQGTRVPFRRFLPSIGQRRMALILVTGCYTSALKVPHPKPKGELLQRLLNFLTH
jgi:hypothetical protein